MDKEEEEEVLVLRFFFLRLVGRTRAHDGARYMRQLQGKRIKYLAGRKVTQPDEASLTENVRGRQAGRALDRTEYYAEIFVPFRAFLPSFFFRVLLRNLQLGWFAGKDSGKTVSVSIANAETMRQKNLIRALRILFPIVK